MKRDKKIAAVISAILTLAYSLGCYYLMSNHPFDGGWFVILFCLPYLIAFGVGFSVNATLGNLLAVLIALLIWLLLFLVTNVYFESKR